MPAPDDWVICTCGHYAASHIRGDGRCRLDDPFGNPCDCREFERGTDDEPANPRKED